MNDFNTGPCRPTSPSRLFKRMSWSIVSNAALSKNKMESTERRNIVMPTAEQILCCAAVQQLTVLSIILGLWTFLLISSV